MDTRTSEVGDEAVYRLLIDAITDYAIYMLNPRGEVVSWNPGAQRFKGYTAAEILGQHFSRFYTPEERAAGLPQIALDTAAREGRYERESWRVRKDGTRFWAHVIIDPIRDSSGNLLGFAKITRDLSERMSAQRALEQAREQLLQAQKMESIGQLTGGIAHDFNNLLAAVMGSLELLRKRIPDDQRAQRLIDNAMMGAERGVSLTKRMLMFARRQELRPQGIDLAEVVSGLRELLEPSLGPQVSIEERFPPGLAPARTDPNQIETAILNLVVNARDAMPEGGKIVISGTERHFAPGETSLPSGDYVALVVSDSGVGMDAETLARAAEPFFTTKGVGKGTGLGLSMVHGLAEQSGGKLILKSKPGEGTTAELWLPRANAVAAPVEASPLASSDAPRELRVLAVDDDPLVLMNTVAMLEDLGHTVVEARSGSEALEVVRGGRAVDVVITDHAMPQMTGAELAQVLERERPGLPVVIATGYAELPAALPRGVIQLSKPFRQQDLAGVLAQVQRTLERA